MRFILSLSIFVFSYALMHAQTDSVYVSGPDSLRDAKNIPTLTLFDLDEGSQGQDVSGLLQSSQDVYSRNAGFNFSAARFRIRGMDGRNFTVHLNGVPVNDPELGFAIWANWGGLNDVTRYPETGAGVSASDYTFGGIQGFSNIDMRASTKRAGTRVSYARSNRSYRNRLMVTHSTGRMANGWSVTGSVSSRFGQEGFVEGTSYSNLAYFLSAEKELSENNTVGVVAFGSPSLRGRSALNTLENFEVRGDNFYNPNWGFQEGEKRNSRMRYSHKPMVMAYWRTKVNDRLDINTTAYTQFGTYYQTRLDWNDANDPRPDYYRNLPSYNDFIQNPEGAAISLDRWANDPTYYQLDWDRFYQANYNNLHTVQNANGVEGETFTGLRSKYIVEASHSDPTMVGLNSSWTYKLSDTERIVTNVNAQIYSSDNYRRLDDLLGGEYWLDINRFVDGQTPGDQGAQNDVDNPNRIIKVDDRYGFSYTMNQHMLDIYTQYDKKMEKLDVYVGAMINTQSVWRDGDYRNELFPNSSKGESERLNYLNGGFKAGATYKLSGRHFLSADVAHFGRAPLIRNTFVSPRTRNTVAPGLSPEEVTSTELTYEVRYPKLKARMTAYTATINNQTNNFTFFSDGSNNLINLVTTDIDQSFMGLEFGFEANMTSTMALSGAIGHGDNVYSNRPLVIAVIDETNQQSVPEQAYLKGLKVGRTPQTAMNIGLQYRDPRFWFIGTNYSYFANIYVDPLSARRVGSGAEGLVADDPILTEIFSQTELDPGGVLNMFAGKSWRFDYKYYLLVTMNMNNVLDKRDFVTGGFEQGRPDSATLDIFANKYAYMFGRTYFAMVRFSF